MIKKSIAGVLVILILINSIGCTSYNQIKKEDANKIERSDRVRITTLDEKVYVLTDVTIGESEVTGFLDPTHSDFLRDIQSKEMVISIKEIKQIEVDEADTSLTIITVFFLIAIPIVFLTSVLPSLVGR